MACELIELPLRVLMHFECRRDPGHGVYAGQWVGFHGRHTVLSECPFCRAEREERLNRASGLEESIRQSQPRIARKTFENFLLEGPGSQRRARTLCERYAGAVDAMLRRSRGLLLWGFPCTGKTHLAAAILNRVSNPGIPAIFARARTLIRDLAEEDVPFFRRCRDTPLLVIDALEEANPRTPCRALLLALLEARGRAGNRAEIFTSCLGPKDLRAALGDALFERIWSASIPVEMSGEPFEGEPGRRVEEDWSEEEPA